MSYFTWKDDGLTSDCASLQAMAARFEETASLMRRMSKEGFEIKEGSKEKLITHKNSKIFDSWGFISEEGPFRQLKLIP